jgi:hypothetical protein
LVDPVVAGAVAGLTAGLDVLAGRAVWGLPDGDLAVLVQVGEVARRRLAMVQVAAAVEAGRRGLPRAAGFAPTRGVPDAEQAEERVGAALVHGQADTVTVGGGPGAGEVSLSSFLCK